MEFLENYDSLLKSFWYIAIPVSLFFLIQTVMTFMGVGGSDAEMEFDSEGHDGDAAFELFSLRNLINFLLGFSWSGISFYSVIPNKIILIFVATLIGVIFVALFFLVIKQILKLNEDNSFKIENTLNQTASVYLTIPEKKSGVGKIQISVNGSVHELQAISEKEKIETGSLVRVLKIENKSVLVVEKI